MSDDRYLIIGDWFHEPETQFASGGFAFRVAADSLHDAMQLVAEELAQNLTNHNDREFLPQEVFDSNQYPEEVEDFGDDTYAYVIFASYGPEPTVIGGQVSLRSIPKEE